MELLINVAENQVDIIAREVTKFIFNYCDRFSLVVRDEFETTARLEKFNKELVPYMVSQSRSSEWPGTLLIDGQMATIRIYELNKDSLNVLNQFDNLFLLSEPDFPEDICFYRPDGRPFLTFISHERDLFFNVDGIELLSLKQLMPNVEFTKQNIE